MRIFKEYLNLALAPLMSVEETYFVSIVRDKER